MSNLYVNRREIIGSLGDILTTAQEELQNGKLHTFSPHDSYYLIPCPKHKGGRENHPSCIVTATRTDEKRVFGSCNCFSCGYHGSLVNLIADSFERSNSWAEQWLISRFGGGNLLAEEIVLPTFDINPPQEMKPTKITLDEDVLSEFAYFHPYMWTRHLTPEVVNRFKIGFDKDKEAITFPVWDEDGDLVMITERSIHSHQFFIPTGVEKPIYLYNDIKNRGVKTVYVCESQINTLTMRTWGYDSIGLFGTGSSHQFDILRQSGITEYVLCYDGDNAGRQGTEKFIRNLKPTMALFKVVILPEGKDINDITKIEFEKLLSCAKTRIW